MKNTNVSEPLILHVDTRTTTSEMTHQAMVYQAEYGGKRSPLYVIVESEPWHSENKVRLYIKAFIANTWKKFVELWGDQATDVQMMQHATTVKARVIALVGTLAPEKEK